MPATEPVPEQQTASDDPVALPTVTVTAEKSGRSLQDTATSAVVLEQTDLDKRAGLESARDVLTSVPNVNLVGAGFAPVVRGIDGNGPVAGFDAAVAGTRARVGVQIDGRPSTFNEIVYGDSDLWDVQQVEVLRGAQSTLQGRNAIAGSMVIKTNDPEFTRDYALRVGGGNYDQRRYSGVVGGPLTEELAFRVAADRVERSSWMKGTVGFPGVDDTGDIENQILRGKLLWEPRALPQLRALLTLNHSEFVGPQTEFVSRPFGKRVDAFGTRLPIFDISSDSAIADLSYEINPNLSFEGLVSTIDFRGERKTLPGQGNGPGKGRNYVVEPRLRFSGEGRASGVAGIHLFQADEPGSSDFGNVKFDDQTLTAAVFGEVTWPLTHMLDLIAGARYEEERRDRSGGNPDPVVAIVVDIDETYRAFLPKLGLAWHPQDSTTLGVQVSRGYNGGGGGGANFDTVRGVTTNYQFDPEYVVTYELFGRQELADGRLRLAANLFYSDYTDMQLRFDLTPENPSDFAFLVDNADEVKTYGVEGSLNWRLTREFEVYANLGLLKTKITSYPDSGFEGNHLPQSAPVSGGGGFIWTHGGWDANLGARYSDSYHSAIANVRRAKVDPYTVVNAQLGYRWGQIRLYGTVTNLLDSDRATFINPVGADAAADRAVLLNPRTLWVGFQWSP